MTRLPQQPGERIDRSRPVSFTFDGKTVQGFAGDTIVSALYAEGRRVFSRSFKYHRPRGELCGCGQCANSLFQIAGKPGVRGCSEPIAEGLEVIHQNAWPSLRFDVMRTSDKIGGPVMPVGFYYKTFIRPRRLWPLYEKVLRNAAGLGRMPEHQDEREWRTEYRRRRCDVLVIGGGVAGLAAALRAAERGADVVLCDEDLEFGGVGLADGHHQVVRELAEQARAVGVELLSGAPAQGFFDGLVPVWQGDVLHQVRADQHIVASGALQQPLVFADNDLPGVMLSGGALRLAAVYGVKPGERAVVVTTDDRGLRDALALHAAGVTIAAVADLRSEAETGTLGSEVRSAGISLLTGTTIARAVGRKQVERAILKPLSAGDDAATVSVACDLIAVSGGASPAFSLLLQAGGRADYDSTTAAFALTQLPDGLHAAGAVAGHVEFEAARASGSVAGDGAADALGLTGKADATAAATVDAHVGRPVATPPASATDGTRGTKSFVDLDEDVTVKDVAYARDEGYDSLELSKRYTTVTMGPTQGRFSQLASARVLAAETGLDLGTVGLTTARPPWSTLPMGALAGRPMDPEKRSALDGRQRAIGANVKWAGDWLRAYDYGDAVAETVAVQDAGGLIDVSSLGKFLVAGPDAGELLDRLYPNRMSTIESGRIRYGVMVSETGRITDDGTVCRLNEDTFYVTTTSGGAAKVGETLTWWQTAWELDARVTDLTAGLGAMNLAGPQARGVLSRLTDLDCSADGLRYLDAKHATVAGVHCLLLRIGFVGEVGYEIHCPAAQAGAVWDAILRVGGDAGIRPFGLEPQRVLRLQKQHPIIGQDTDSEMTPYGAGMDWIVKLDKEQDFIGKWALEDAADVVPHERLVGFTTEGPLPTEGAAVVTGSKVIGQVTSARRSPRLGQVIGLATVPASLAQDDATFVISDDGARITATVRTTPFYDPEGEVVRG